jgi:hypothetical protein
MKQATLQAGGENLFVFWRQGTFKLSNVVVGL